MPWLIYTCLYAIANLILYIINGATYVSADLGATAAGSFIVAIIYLRKYYHNIYFLWCQFVNHFICRYHYSCYWSNVTVSPRRSRFWKSVTLQTCQREVGSKSRRNVLGFIRNKKIARSFIFTVSIAVSSKNTYFIPKYRNKILITVRIAV